MDITSVAAARIYGAARPATAPDPAAVPQAMAAAVGSFAETLARGEQAANATLVEGADPHSLITALAEAELAVETAVTVRNKMVEAYLEILRMPV